MSYNNGPKINTTGLIVCLDPRNSKSYPGSGTTVYDLSGQQNHFTLQDSSAFIAGENVFRFTYGGTNWLERSTLLTGFTAGSLSAYSFAAYVKITDASTGRFFSHDNLGQDTTNRLNYYLAPTNISGEKNNVFGFSSGLSTLTVTNNWAFFGGTLNAYTSTMYRGTTTNRFEVGTMQTFPSSSPEIGSYTLIGRRGVDTNFGGDIGLFMIYNKALTAAEMFQTFTGTRARYGI
jgi:hypothetical protein